MPCSEARQAIVAMKRFFGSLADRGAARILLRGNDAENDA
jgi:hypothetical protein